MRNSSLRRLYAASGCDQLTPCCASHAINCGNGMAPLCLATSRPLRNRIRLGIERMPSCVDSCALASL